MWRLRSSCRCALTRVATAASEGRSTVRVARPKWLASSPAHVSEQCALAVACRAFHEAQSETISPDDISFLSEEPAAQGDPRQYTTCGGAASRVVDDDALSAASSPELPSVFEEVRVVDAFSRARVVNFVKRYSKGKRIEGARDVFTVKQLDVNSGHGVTGGADGDEENALYHCYLELPLSHPSSEGGSATTLWAHGVAFDEKEAELLSAMHAERIIDAMGYHIYTLPSMQRKHALAARSAGRPAPFPDDAAHPDGGAVSAAFPKPLRRVRARDETEDGKWQLIDLRRSHHFQSSSPSTTLLSPCVLDTAAQTRVELFFRAKGFYFAELLSVAKEAAAQTDDDALFLATITFPRELLAPLDANSGDDRKVVACGKARIKDKAVSLACMHAELVLDALGIPLFPHSDAKQKEHAMTAWGYGRPAPLCGATPKDAAHVSLPLPLKELIPAGKGGRRFCVLSGEEDLVHRHRVVGSQITDFRETNVGESTAVADLQSFLQSQKQPRAVNPFFHEVIEGTVKSTVVLPVAGAFGIRGGVGIATREADADVLAAMHALDVLTALEVPVKSADEAANRQWVAERVAKVHQGRALPTIGPADRSPPGWRLASGARTFSSTVAVRGDRSAAQGQAPPKTEAGQGTEVAHANPEGMRPGSGAAEATMGKPRRVAKRAKAAASVEATPPRQPEGSEGQAPSDTASTDRPCPTAEESHLLAVREKVPKELWSLDADSPDGYIMVAPQSPRNGGESNQDADAVSPRTKGAFSDAALRSPRQLDPLAKARVTQYLAKLGRRFEDVFFTQFLDKDENGGQGVHRCAATLPVPSRFGDRIALGEAANLVDAEHLAAMHAELLLDTLGVCLFTDPKRQKRHAESCAQYGRWAPSGPGEERAVETKSPPPLRREYVGSLYWERLQGKKSRIRTLSKEGRRLTAPEADAAATESAHSPTALFSDAEALPCEEAEGATSYTTVTEGELDLVSKPRVQYYLRRRRGSHAVTIDYTMTMTRSAILHEATWSLPLPENAFAEAECTVKGIAATKRDAEVLSWMHAERVLDALHVPLFDNLPGLQQWHAAQAAKQGRTAPVAARPKETPKKDAVLPPLPPLRLVTGATSVDGRSIVRPVYPDLSAAAEGKGDRDGSDVWADYVESCAVYIQETKLAADNAFFALSRVPRSGEPLLDRTLDAVEEQSIQVESKQLLSCYCAAAGTPYPSFWKSQSVGPLTHRVVWAVVPVPGFDSVLAQGVGENKEDAQRRAAMHALELLSHLDSDYSLFLSKAHSMRNANAAAAAAASSDATDSLDEGEADDEFDLETYSVSLTLPTADDPLQGDGVNGDGDGDGDGVEGASGGGGSSSVSRGRHANRRRDRVQPAYSAKLGRFTFEGKVRLVQLLALCMGVSAPVTRRTVRLTQEDTQSPRKVCFHTTITFTDDNGKIWEGASSAAGQQHSERLAYEQLYEALNKGVALFAEVKDLILKDPYLNPRDVPNVTMSAAVKDKIHALVGNSAAASLGDRGEVSFEECGEVAADLERFAAVKQAAARADRGDNGAAAEARCLFGFAKMDAFHLAQESQYLLEKHKRKLAAPAYLDHYAKARERLSITARKAEIIRGIEKHQVLIICGTTGCGKTTQVPQFILENATSQRRGGECSIVVTQPRRLSAVSIAQRVAAERLEKIGDSTGYAIRFDSQPGRHINFCTSGVLLRMLHSSPTLEGINYLIIDEIHERDINSDFLIVLLKDLLVQRPDLRIVLMSATLQAEQFGLYFDNAPIINVEGYVYPVQELFLEDLAAYAEEHHFKTPLLKEAAAYGGKGRQAANNGFYDDDGFDRYGSRESTMDRARSKYGVLEATTEIDYPTIQFAIEQAVRMVDLSRSSVLVFLPGWEEITRAKEILERRPEYHIIPLHSSVGQEEQMQCFLPTAEGKVKVILSTNIAESGVTIDDVGAVIDVGRAKEKAYVSTRGRTNVGNEQFGSVSKLLTVYASRANCVQRRGRVGRTRPGVCIRLYSKAHFDSLHHFQTPEMLRTPLDSLCLQILSLNLGDPVAFLQRALEPPEPTHVEAALQRLHELGATTSKRELTPLGLRLAMLPVDPRMGKVIILGVLLRCLDSALTIASVAQTDVFLPARSSREAVRLHKEDLSKGTQSDPIASVNGFNFWVSAHYQKRPAEVVVALQERLLSVPHLMMVSRHKKQFHDILKASGFLVHGRKEEDAQGGAAARADDNDDVFVDRSPLSQDATDVGLLKCVVAAGFFPNVAILQGRRSLRTKLQNHVSTSTDSVLHRTAAKHIQQPFFVFSEMVKSAESSRLTARDLTNISLWTLLLLSTENMSMSYNQELSLVFVDEWIPFRITFGTLEMVRKLKRVLHLALNRAYTDPADEENNVRLEQVRLILKELVNTPVKANTQADGDTVWADSGVVIEPQTGKRMETASGP